MSTIIAADIGLMLALKKSGVQNIWHPAYQNFLGSDPAANKSAMLDDAAEYLYDTQVAEKYFPMTKTTRFTTEKTGGTTAGERTQKQIVDKIKSLGELSETNVNKYNDVIPTNMREKGYKIAYKNGNAYIVSPDKKTGKLKGTPFSMEAYSQILGTKPGALPILNK